MLTNGTSSAVNTAKASDVTSGAASYAGVSNAGENQKPQNDMGHPATDPKFGEILQKIQGQYGAKPTKPREAKKTLGKDDFLKIMISQMKNQDPTSPFKAEQMAAQMAQFATVEQLTNINQGLTKLGQAQQPTERMAMTGMIGKVVTIDRDRFVHTENQGESLSYNLSRDADDVRIVVMNEAGEAIIDKQIGPQKKGDNAFTWDGLKENSLAAKAGNYIFKVEATDSQGRKISTAQQSQGKIIGISFEGAEPVFLVGDAKHQQKIGLKNIVRIESDGSAMSLDDLTKLQEAIPTQAAQNKKMFEFKKEPDKSASAQGHQPMKMAQAQQAQQMQQPESKGFPSGLSDPEQQLNRKEVKANE